MRAFLLRICAAKVAANIVDYRDGLPLLPCDIQIFIANMVLEKKPKPYIYELQILCDTVWNPTKLCLRGVPCLSVQGLQKLAFVKSLVKLDFSGCGSWLHSLSFLPGLLRLECLILRDCWRLSGGCLSFIHELHGLRCLDLENVYMITDAWASYFIPGMRSLQALNMSGTNISDQFLEALTYGSRLQSWATGQELTTTSDRPIGMGSQQYHALDIIFLRLQHTKISEGVIPWLSSLNELKLLDVRFTDLPGRSLDGIKGPSKSQRMKRKKTRGIILSLMGCQSSPIKFHFMI